MEDINIKITDKKKCFAVIINEGEDVDVIFRGSEVKIAAAILASMDKHEVIRALIEKVAFVYATHKLEVMRKTIEKNA